METTSDRGAMVSDFEREVEVEDVEVEVESPSTTMSGSESPTTSPTSDGAQPSVFPPSVAQAQAQATTISGGAGTPVPMETNAHGLTGGEGTRKQDEKQSGMELSLTPFTPVDLSGKRGRGRPRGSGKRQVLATLGEWFALSAGGNFTPHVVTVATGEDVATRILSFSQKGPRSICILSANGSISNVTLRQPGSCGGTLTYEGRFEILSLSGSFTLSEDGGARSRTGGLSISLAGPDGRVIGGGVAGLLLAASPIQVVVGSFVPNTVKAHKRRASGNPEQLAPTIETRPDLLPNASVRPISQVAPNDGRGAVPVVQGHVTPISQVAPNDGRGAVPVVQGHVTPISQVAPNDNRGAVPVVQGHASQGKVSAINMESTNPVPFRMVGWPREGFPLAEQRASPDINICLQQEQ